ncbi:hypothetical protein J4E85_010976 [Alternaria conjuncta]|uniref:uncharacterized protein n=1 Tax=Alternaria conjuncta TaxID=181017 RepID=UPI00221F59CB|nr:uncharacterized protein J4E85_010976 [Alternaria conjuncta]KAI4913001.1 hypothetical protein J4E85_010976 [Alternaria conjuncta]
MERDDQTPPCGGQKVKSDTWSDVSYERLPSEVRNDRGRDLIAQLSDINENDLLPDLRNLWITFQLHELDAGAASKMTQAAELEAQSAALVAQAEVHKSEAAKMRVDAARTYAEAAELRLRRARRDLEAWLSTDNKT